MESGRQHSRFLRVDQEHPVSSDRLGGLSESSAHRSGDPADESPLGETITATLNFLAEQQQMDGCWSGDVQCDVSFVADYVLLLTFMERENSADVWAAARTLLAEQSASGGWSLFPGGQICVSVSVKAYLALKIAGVDPEAPALLRARNAILAAGGIEQVDSLTRYWLALLGQITYRQCPAVPPEMIMLRRWTGCTIHDMAAWARTTLVPLSLLWAYQPVRLLSPGQGIEELFTRSPRKFGAYPKRTAPQDVESSASRVPWAALARLFDRSYKLIESIGEPPYRKKGIRLASAWMLERIRHEDGLGADFSSIGWSLIALKSLGFEDKSIEVLKARQQIERLLIRSGKTQDESTVPSGERTGEPLEDQPMLRVLPLRAPISDTAICVQAFQETGQQRCEGAIERATIWLREQEIRQPGDWAIQQPDVEPSGWGRQTHNPFYPRTDTTASVVVALSQSLPHDLHADWLAEFVPQSDNSGESQLSTVVSGKTSGWRGAIADVTRLQPQLESLRRGVQWLLAMQSENGGWGTCSVDSHSDVLAHIPLADVIHMTDPASADCTAQVLVALASLGIDRRHPAVERALNFLWKSQSERGSWAGRWGVHHLYGTWRVLEALQAIGVDQDHPRLRDAAYWLKSVQQETGGWGESPESGGQKDFSNNVRQTATQTAWALLGLMAAGEGNCLAVERGVRFLIKTQQPLGFWHDSEFTAVRFPGRSYLKYDLQSAAFPVLALARYRRLQQDGMLGLRSH